MYSLVVVPINLAFEFNDSITLKILTQINTIIFIIDIFVNFFVAFRKQNFEIEDNLKIIA